MGTPTAIEPSIIIVGSIVIIILAVFTTLFFIVFVNKKKKLMLEKEFMKTAYDKAILQSQLEIQEQTFTTISQEIHDNVGQILSLAKVQLNIIEESETNDKALLKDARENISKAMTDLRDIAKGLSSERIRVIGLVPAVEQEVQRINRTGIVYIQLWVEGNKQPSAEQNPLIIFRVIQECLQNILKHAAASLVTIRFSFLQERLSIQIHDNGKGFQFDPANMGTQGLGLQNIFKRINLIGGNATIHSMPQEGTTIQLNIPYV